MGTEELLVERDGPVLVVTLNREERMNALSEALHAALPETWQSVHDDPSIRAIIITGKGTRAFCAGGDLKERASTGGHRDRGGGRASVKEGLKMTPLQNDIWAPVIVAVNGLCVAAGFHFVCDADVVIASTNAAFLDTHAVVGQVSALEPIGLLPRIGLGNVLRMITLGREGRLSAHDTLRISLVDEVVEPDQLLPRAKELAFAAAKASPTTLERSKRVIWNAIDLPLGEALQHGFDVLRNHRTHPDYLEGMRAFAEKREPVWANPYREGNGDG